MSPTVITSEQFLVTAYAGTPNTPGYTDLGQWSSRTGGDVTAPISDHFFGGMDPPVAAGGRRTMDTVELRRPFAYGDAGLIINLAPRVGLVRIHCTMQALDGDRHPFGAGFVVTGTLAGIVMPEHDAANEGDSAPWGLTIKPDVTLGATNT